MKKQAVLTIDDAPSSGMNEKLAFLASKGIHAIWFCNGVHLNAQREAALRALREGHLLANHAWEHIRFSEHSFEEAQSQVRRTEQLLEALYREAGSGRRKDVPLPLWGQRFQRVSSASAGLAAREVTSPVWRC